MRTVRIFLVILPMFIAFAQDRDESLKDAIQHLDSTFSVLTITRRLHVLDDEVVPQDIVLEIKKGGILDVSPGKTLTISGTLVAGSYSIFSGLGDVRILNSSKIEAAWFGMNDGKSASSTNALALQKAIHTVKISGNNNGASIQINSGQYFCSSISVDCPNIVIRGVPKKTTLHYSGSDSALFNIGIKKAQNGYNYYYGKNKGFTLEDINLTSEEGYARSNGSKTKIAIQDNANGSVKLSNCSISGFRYGYLGVVGTPFLRILDCTFSKNDVGIYLSIASEQAVIQRSNFWSNGIGILLDRAPHGAIRDCVFTNNDVTGIRFLVNNITQTGYFGGNTTELYVLDGNWFENESTETNHGSYFIEFVGNPSGRFANDRNENITIANSIVVWPASAIRKDSQAKYAFVYLDKANNIKITNTVIAGKMLDACVDVKDKDWPGFVAQEDTRNCAPWTVVPRNASYRDTFSGTQK